MGRGKRRFSLWPTPWKTDDGIHGLEGESLPKGLYGLIWRLSAGDQVWLCLLSGAIALLNTAPIEVQRRVVDRSLKEGSFRSITIFVVIYAALVLVQGSIKLLFNLYRSWVSEHAIRTLRSFLNAKDDPEGPQAAAAKRQGTEISMIIAESEPIGAFFGEAISEVLLQVGIMISVAGYLIFLQPLMSLVLIGVYLPQLVFVPLMQRAITRRAEARIAVLRSASAAVVGAPEEEGERRHAQEARFARVFSLNMGVYTLKYSMNFLMNLCHQLGIAAILGVGGWFVVTGKTQVGTIVAFISGLATVKDPWDDLTTWFQTMMVTRARYGLFTEALAKTKTPATGGDEATASPDR